MSPAGTPFSTAPWQLARLSRADEIPAAGDWLPATVPGDVQLDWARARKLPELNYGKDGRACEGIEESFWLYRTTVPAVPPDPAQRLFLAGALLETLLHLAPKRADAPPTRAQADHATKPAVSYGWDWHPRLITLDLREEVRFELRPAAHLRVVDFAYTLAADFSTAAITVPIETSVPAAARWRLRDPDDDVVVIESAAPRATLPHPRLWWTDDRGKPALHSLEIELASVDRLSRAVGFRCVRLVMHDGAWVHPAEFPKSRSPPPITVELNGRRICTKGSNWVTPGTITADTYRPLLLLARDAHFNLLRGLGGAPVAKESFLAQCDALGQLVWQEFPLACKLYPDDPAYLAQLDRESCPIPRRLRQHPCLALWCGGNELFNGWSRMTDQSLPLRLLNRNCDELDPATPFLPTAPLDGMGHGDYRFLGDHDRDSFQSFQSATHTANSEFRCAGPASRHLTGPVARFVLPALSAATEFTLELTVADPSDWSSRNRPRLLPAPCDAQVATPTLNA